MDRHRFLAPLALLITAAAVPYAAGAAVTGWEPRLGWLFQALIHAGELLAVLALALSPAGRGPAVRIGLGAALLGQATLTAAEVIWPRNAGLGDMLFTVGPLLTGVGLIVAGIAVVRGGILVGWPRFAPLAVGTYVFAVLIPVMIASGGPPAPAALWTIAAWDLLWVLTASTALRLHPGEHGRSVSRFA
jgi:hypothetical protein